jgi:hypothetical protein
VAVDDALLQLPMEEAFAHVAGPQCAVTVKGRHAGLEAKDRVEK